MEGEPDIIRSLISETHRTGMIAEPSLELGMRFILKTLFAASCLGVAMDMVTAHVAVEYFTVHHPHVVNSKSPLVMALVWGVGASWWFGLIAGSWNHRITVQHRIFFHAADVIRR